MIYDPSARRDITHININELTLNTRSDNFGKVIGERANTMEYRNKMKNLRHTLSREVASGRQFPVAVGDFGVRTPARLEKSHKIRVGRSPD